MGQESSCDNTPDHRAFGRISLIGAVTDVVVISTGVFFAIATLPAFDRIVLESETSASILMSWLAPLGISGLIVAFRRARSTTKLSRQVTKAGVLALLIFSMLPLPLLRLWFPEISTACTPMSISG